MATAQRHCDTSMSDEAYDLITSYYNGVDVVVRELAEQIAADDESYLPDDPTILAIEVRHVREAGRRVVESLRKLLKDGELPLRLEQALAEMENRFDNKD